MTALGPTELRLLGGVVAGASQQQLARVVALIDGLSDRTEADRLLERVRPRLRSLGLPRRMGFTRLLFLPMDSLIVPPRGWKAGSLTLPRTALTPLSREVEALLGELAAKIEALRLTQAPEHARTIAALGAELWPAALSCLPEAPPATWQDAGLAGRDYPLMRKLCVAAWRHAGTTWPALCAAAEGPPEELARRALEPPMAEEGVALEVVLRSLMAVAARPASMAALAARLAPKAGHPAVQVAQRAVDDFLQRQDPAELMPDILQSEAGRAAATALAVCTLVEDFEESGFLGMAVRRNRLQAIRKAADEACRSIFAGLLSTDLLEPVARLADRPDDEVGAAMHGLEEAARALRRVEGSGRRLGGADGYDAALRSAKLAIAAAARSGTGTAGLRRTDALRLIEILVGPDAAQQAV